MEPEEGIHSKPDDPYTVRTYWDDEGFHIQVQADIAYDEAEPDDVRKEIQTIAQDITEAIFRGTTFKRYVGQKPVKIERKDET
jgi:hypothetical protein